MSDKVSVVRRIRVLFLFGTSVLKMKDVCFTYTLVRAGKQHDGVTIRPQYISSVVLLFITHLCVSILILVLKTQTIHLP
jgi:hypothetical protein